MFLGPAAGVPRIKTRQTIVSSSEIKGIRTFFHLGSTSLNSIPKGPHHSLCYIVVYTLEIRSQLFQPSII